MDKKKLIAKVKDKVKEKGLGDLLDRSTTIKKLLRDTVATRVEFSHSYKLPKGGAKAGYKLDLRPIFNKIEEKTGYEVKYEFDKKNSTIHFSLIHEDK